MIDLLIKIRGKVIRFLLSGVFMRIATFVVNWILIEDLLMDKKESYVIVLILDFVLGFFINKYYVYRSKFEDKLLFIKFLITGATLRILSYYIYSITLFLFKNIELMGFVITDYFIAQTASVLLIIVFKFFIYEYIFEQKSSLSRQSNSK